MIKAVFFDYYGVVGHWDEDVLFENFSKMFDIPKQRVSKIIYDENWLNELEGANKITQEFLNYLNHISAKSIDLKEFYNVITNVYSDNQDVVDYIKTIKDKYRVFVVQNAMLLDLPWQKENLNSLRIFEKVYSSAQVGARKDKVKFFETVLRETKLKPEEVLYVDDGQKYVDTGKKCGLNAYLYKDIYQIKEILKNDK